MPAVLKARATLPPWSQRLIAELDAIDPRADRLVRELSHQQLNWSSTPGSWSIGQCIEHLCITNELYIRAISLALEDQKRSPVQEVIPGGFSRWFIRNYVAPSPKGTRAPAPRKIRPAAKVETSILDTFLRSNTSARELISRAGDYDVNRIRFKNPFIPLLRFTAGTGLEIISKHESRHLLQAERVRQSPGFPSR